MKVLRVLGCLWCHMEQLGGRRVAYMGPLPHTQSSESRPRRPFVECACVWVWGRGPISHRGGRSVKHRACVWVWDMEGMEGGVHGAPPPHPELESRPRRPFVECVCVCVCVCVWVWVGSHTNCTGVVGCAWTSFVTSRKSSIHTVKCEAGC